MYNIVPYQILQYSYNQAKKLGVVIKPSLSKRKKIDVFKNGMKIASIGALGYGDYPHYLQINKELADKKRAEYKARHFKDRSVVGSPGFYADQILW